MRLVNIDNFISLVLTSYKFLHEPSQGCACVVPFVVIWQGLLSSGLLLLAALLLIRVGVFGAQLLFSLPLGFVSLLTGYPYKPHYYIRGNPREIMQVDLNMEFKKSIF